MDRLLQAAPCRRSAKDAACAEVLVCVVVGTLPACSVGPLLATAARPP